MAIIIGILEGMLLPIQTSINTNLKKKVGSTYNASLVSFSVAFVFLSILLILTGQGIGIPFSTIGQEPFWIWMGGLCGVIVITGNIFLFIKLGSVQTVVLPIFGQILMGLLIDNFGFFHGEKTPITILCVVGAVLVMMGVVVISLAKEVKSEKISKEIEDLEEKGKEITQTNKQDQSIWLWRIFGVVSGMISSTQIAVNSYLGKVVGSPIKGAFISFSVGTIVLLLVFLFRKIKNHSKPVDYEKSVKAPWWIWFGGILGGMYVMTNVFISGMIGTGFTVVLSIMGATTAGVLVDQFGLLGAQKKPINAMKVIGILLMISGVVAIELF